MVKSLYAFPRFNGSRDPLIGLAKEMNLKHPGFIRLVVDGGAGVGSFTDAVINDIADASVICFEPLPNNVRVLRSRFGQRPAVKIRETALGDRPATVTFEVPDRLGIPDTWWEPGTSYGGFVSRSLLVPTLKNWAKRVLGRETPRYQRISVQMARLDSQLEESPDLLKLDLQGGEPEAINGLGGFLAKTKVIKLEVIVKGGVPGQGLAKSQCFRALREAGFLVFVCDFHFAVPQLSVELRGYLTRCGVEIEWEKQFPSQREMHVCGRWPENRPLPIESQSLLGKPRVGLNSELENLLSESGALFFSIDLIALNRNYAQQWQSVLSESLLKNGEA
jgi:FkbM family methyltransferase